MLLSMVLHAPSYLLVVFVKKVMGPTCFGKEPLHTVNCPVVPSKSRSPSLPILEVIGPWMRERKKRLGLYA